MNRIGNYLNFSNDNILFRKMSSKECFQTNSLQLFELIGNKFRKMNIQDSRRKAVILVGQRKSEFQKESSSLIWISCIRAAKREYLSVSTNLS